jgi:hypothetical protein
LYTKAVALLPSQRSYFVVWKQFLCYIFRVLAYKLSQRLRIYNLAFRSKEIQQINYILSLIADLQQESPDKQPTDNIESNLKEEIDEEEEVEYVRGYTEREQSKCRQWVRLSLNSMESQEDS